MEIFPCFQLNTFTKNKKYRRENYFLLFQKTLKTALVLLILLSAQVSFSQTTPPARITGTVVDDNNVALPGVNILIGKTKKVISTNENGRFDLTVESFPVTLAFSMVGFVRQEVVFQNATTDYKVSLAQNNKLNEVLIIGYGTTTRAKNTSSISKVEGPTLVQQPISNPVLGLQGRVSGMYITTASGNLGANVNVTIRGTNTIASSSNPLYIVDGVPMPSTGINAVTYGGAGGTHSPFINLNSADIESVEVLKDADGTAIYGSRGANGVVLITTKKAKAGPTRISADFYRGVQSSVNQLDLLNTQEYIQMRKEAFALDGITNLTNTNAYDILTWGEERYTDLQELLFGKTAAITDAQFNVNGGNEQTQFMFGVGYHDENGVLMGKNNQRKGSARLNVSHRSSNNRFTANSTLTYSSTTMGSIGTSGFNYAWLAPNIPLVDETTGLPYFYGTASNTQSPLRYTYSTSDLSNFNFIGAATIGYKILDNLQLKVDGSFTRLDYRGVEKYRNGYVNPNENTSYKNFAVFGNDYQHTYNIEPQVNFQTPIWKGKLTALAGSTFQQTIAGGQLVQGQNFPSELLMDALGSAGLISSYSTTYNQYKFNSVFGRLTYDLKDTYIFNATYRRDGSSRFGPDKRFGDFWAIGGAWILSNEPFLKDHVKFINLAKIRSSYGLTGNDAIGNYQFMETFTSTPNPYNYNSGLYANRLGNSEFGWETNRKFEVAAELNFLNNRITTTTAFFNNISGNQLINYPVPTQTGWASYVANLDAKIRNRGWEFDLTSQNINGKSFKWRSNFNITTFKNTLLEFPNLKASAYSAAYEVGKSINVYRRYEFIGIDPQTGTPLTKDQDGSGTYTVDDYISYGNSDAKFYGGLGNTFSFKGLELDFFFQFTKRPYANGYINSSNASQPGIIFNQPKFLLEGTWRYPGDTEATRPRLSTVNSGAFATAYNRYRFSNAGIVDGSYIRLKNVSLSYNLPAKFVQKMKVSNVRVYGLAQNLFTITKYEGYDPETPGTVTPPLQVYTFGLNVSL